MTLAMQSHINTSSGHPVKQRLGRLPSSYAGIAGLSKSRQEKASDSFCLKREAAVDSFAVMAEVVANEATQWRSV